MLFVYLRVKEEKILVNLFCVQYHRFKATWLCHHIQTESKLVNDLTEKTDMLCSFIPSTGDNSTLDANSRTSGWAGEHFGVKLQVLVIANNYK